MKNRRVKETRGEVMVQIVSRDIENEPAIETKRDLSLAYSVAAERAGQKSESRKQPARPVARPMTRTEFAVEQEANFSIT